MRLKRRIGCFGLYGFDLLIDDQMKVWLIEINVNPSLTTNTKKLSKIIPNVVQESIRSFILNKILLKRIKNNLNLSYFSFIN